MANFFDQFDASSAKGNFFDQYDAHTESPGFTDRLKNAWDKATPGGPLWLAKQAVEGVKGSVEGSIAAVSPEPTTEEGAAQRNQLIDQGPGAAMQAASVMSPGVPGGTGGILAAPIASATARAAATAAPKELPPVVQAAQRLTAETGQNVAVPRAIASDNMAMQRAGQGVRNLPVVGDAIPKATNQLVESLGDATRTVADQYGAGSGPNIANRIGQTIQGAAEAETGAATNVARRSDEAVLAAWQRDVDTAHQDVAGREAQSLQAARAAVGDMSPQDMGQQLNARLRIGEQEARANKDRLYGLAGESDASVRADSVQGVHNRVSAALDDVGRVVDPDLMPASNRMMNELQNFSQLRIPNRVGAPAPDPTTVTAVDARGMEQIRKRLSGFSQAANNDADRAAARIIMRQFDEWQADAYENALFSGSPEALQLARDARAANTAWRQRFHNDRDDADQVINRIVTGEVTPQETANYIIGAGKAGAKGVSSRLLTRITEATGDDPDAMEAIRGGIWNSLSQSTEGANPKTGASVTKDVMEFLNGSGRDVAQRLFTPEQQRMMRAYADTLRAGQDARALIGDVAAATKPGSMDVPAGPMKQLADAVIGKGTKSDEALFNAIDSYAKSGNRADVGTLAKLVQAIPQEERTNLAGSIIRNIGISPRTGKFSPDVFVSQWNTYTPQAKAVLFGNAGSQRQSIDDIALISQRLKDIGSKFGNPSGTSQNVNFAALSAALATAAARIFAGDIVTPLAMLGSALGGAGVAKFLAAPAGASSAAKWSSAYSKAALAPSPQTLALFKVATRNLTSTAQSLGIKVSPGEMLRPLQGPVPAGAQDEKS